MKTPFARSYWADPGRLLAGFYPGDRDRQVADQKLQSLIDFGITSVICLMEEDEKDHAGRPFISYAPRFQELSGRAGKVVSWERFPIRDLSIPSKTGMCQILDRIDAEQQKGGAVYVHCWGGRGRTGTVVACYLRRRFRLSGEDALTAVQTLTRSKADLFWPTPEMAVQREFVQRWEVAQ
jgi:hypothetical protein